MKKNYKNISVISTGSWVPTDLNKKIKIDNSVIRFLTVKYKKLDTKNEYFKKKNKA